MEGKLRGKKSEEDTLRILRQKGLRYDLQLVRCHECCLTRLKQDPLVKSNPSIPLYLIQLFKLETIYNTIFINTFPLAIFCAVYLIWLLSFLTLPTDGQISLKYV